MVLPLVPVLGVIAVAVSYNQRMLDPLTALLARDLAVTASAAVALSPAFSLPYALGQPFLGPIADSYGKALVLKLCMAVVFAATLATLFVSDYQVLFALRLITGLAGGGIIPTCLALIADRTPIERRQLTLSRFMVAMIAGQLFTAPISAFLAERWGWEASASFAVAMALLAMGLVVARVPARRDVARPPLSLSRAVATYRGILADGRARACYAGVLAEGGLVFGFTPHIALVLEERRLGGAVEAGYVLAGMGLGGLVYAVLVGHLVKRYSMFTMMQAGALLLALGLGITAFAGGWPLMMAAYGALGFGFYMMHSGLQAQVSEIDPLQRASLISLHAFFMFLGIAGGPMAFGWVQGLIGSTAALALAALGIGAVGVAVARYLAAWKKT